MNKLLLLNGMTPGGRVFRRLVPLLPEVEVIDWIAPEGSRTLSEYARALADRIGPRDTCDVLGISFGGMVAQELAPLIGAGRCFVVSSIASRSELGLIPRLAGNFPGGIQDRILRCAGKMARAWRTRPSSTTVRARKFSGSDGAWFRWASNAVMGWRKNSSSRSVPIIRIHGDRDRTFPSAHRFSDHVIEGADHLLALSHAEILAGIVTRYRQLDSMTRYNSI